MANLVCAKCGVEFYARSQARYCADCRYTVERQRKREYSLNRYRRLLAGEYVPMGTNSTRTTCKACGKLDYCNKIVRTLQPLPCQPQDYLDVPDGVEREKYYLLPDRLVSVK